MNQGKRMASNRHNPYFAPGGLAKLATGLDAIDCSNTSNPQTYPVIGSAPPCHVQAPIEFDGKAQSFPQLTRDPP
jgi:hypothetical protein